MTVVEELNQIALRMVEEGIELPSFAVLSYKKMRDLLIESAHFTLYNSNNVARVDKINRVCISSGVLDIVVNEDLPDHHVSVGRMTINDIIIEDILLDLDSLDWLED